ncbi:putative RING finger protein [Suhomyces tanzawaensis NRRL Y-17324]|uniref:Putative RING finger protein n=1 Tax=Suhomyces tanzawaensis NRRL Y-17324 TaxID=984487 RepID=A0A1E4SEY3_9ASCO|nr:putative RING finger protein [Suhomyces tanzawaensis NRRL Y-17324]ODV78081.1 putative RING finger protein [Suhomyces tanzawaensis NRRL Y-17324]
MIGTDSYHITIDITTSEDGHKFADYRYSDIEVTTISAQPSMSQDPKEPIEPIKAQLLGNGVIRLFREFEEEDISLTPVQNDNVGDGTMVAILAVPTYFTATDLLGFIGENHMKYVSHLRLLKSEKPNRFLVLIKFRDIINAAEFQFQFDGKPFNSMEPQKCHVVYVKSVKMEYETGKIDDSNSLIPFLLADPFTAETEMSSPSNTLIELPTCPVCLERMDSEVTGLLTIPCQHTFHCQCLSKWKDDSCPICRYSNNFSNQQVRRSARRLSLFSMQRRPQLSSLNSSIPEVPDATEKCMGCTTTSGLWICLVCGNIGCGRYSPEQHSLNHFINTGHCFAMELDTSRVWDYAGDNYVHRLVTNESDGKLVELPEKQNKPGYLSSSDKADEVDFEYSQLLISQLASQREYYESLLNEREAPKSRKGSRLSSVDNRMMELENRLKDLTLEFTQLSDGLIPSLQSKIQAKDSKLEKISTELNQSNSLNEALSKKVDYLQEINDQLKGDIKTLNEEKQGLSEQVNDLMFFLDSQEKFKNEPEDVRDGTVVVQQKPTRKALRKKKK